MIRAIIIDDEEKSRKLLRNLVGEYCPEIEVIDLADSVGAGLKSINKHNPDLIFLDIEMGDGTGFDLLEKLKGTKLEVIFTTAYDQYAIQAFHFSAIDYLLKPIDIDELKKAVSKVGDRLNVRDEKNVNEKLQVLVENNRSQSNNKKISLPTQTGINFVLVRDIVMCKAEGNYSIINIKDRKQQEIVSRTLKDFEEMLNGFNFFRVHRTYLINLDHIKEYNRTNQSDDYDGDGGSVVMNSGIQVPVSRDRRKYLLEKFSKPF